MYPLWEQENLAYAKGLQNAHISFGKELEAKTDKTLILAMDDAGAGPFYAERYTIDMLGLNDLHIAHLPGKFYEKYDIDYVLAKHPDVIVLLSKTSIAKDKNDFLVPSHAALFLHKTFQSSYSYKSSYKFNNSYFLLIYTNNTSTYI
jgi:hypothetical protein